MKLDEHDLNQLLVAKHMFEEGERLAMASTTPVGFSAGLILTHDSVLLFLSALASHLGFKTEKRTFPELWGDIDSYQRTKKPKVLPRKSALASLNTVRNALHHSGVLPDKTVHAHLISEARVFLAECFAKYYGKAFEKVSLSLLIRDLPLRTRIESIQDTIRQGKKEQAVIEMAGIFYELFESRHTPGFEFEMLGGPSPFPLVKKRYSVPPTSGTEVDVSLLQLGIDRGRYSRFKALTPRIARDRSQTMPVHKWEKEFDFEENWNSDNLSFCMDFLVEVAIKSQEKRQGWASDLIPLWLLYEDEIEPTGDEARFYSRASYSESSPALGSRPREIVYILKRGSKICAMPHKEWSDDATDTVEEILIMSSDLPHLPDHEFGMGWVNVGEVRITKRRRRNPGTPWFPKE